MHNLALAVLCLRRVYLAELHELREQLFNLHLAPSSSLPRGGESKALASESWRRHTV